VHFLRYAFSRGFGVEHIRAKIHTVWPDDGFGLGIDFDLAEVIYIMQWLKYATMADDPLT
jgi:hypothetical protein